MADIWTAAGVKRPSQLIEDVLNGITPYEEADRSTQSVVGMEYRWAANEVLAGDTKEEKRRRLDRVPDHAKKYVEQEIKRILKNDTGKAS